MDRTLVVGIVTLLYVFLVGCSTVDSRIHSNPQTFSSLSSADQTVVRQGGVREGMPKAAVYLSWGRPDRVRYGSRAGVPFEAWTYTTIRSEVGTGDYPSFYGFGYYRYGWYRPYFGNGGYYGYPFSPYLGDDIVSYEVPYKTAFFEKDRCTGWEYLR
jgi:hypothetical protein